MGLVHYGRVWLGHGSLRAGLAGSRFAMGGSGWVTVRHGRAWLGHGSPWASLAGSRFAMGQKEFGYAGSRGQKEFGSAEFRGQKEFGCAGSGSVRGSGS